MKHFRGYYRCTHRHTQGCLATKQVQRNDEDAMVLDVTYNGIHTCQQKNTKPNYSNLLIAKQEIDQHRDQDTKQFKSFKPEVECKTEYEFDSDLMQFPVPSFLSDFSETTNLFPLSDISNNYVDFNDWIPIGSSSTNSPVPEMDFEKLEFDPNFSMDASWCFT